MYGWWQKNPWRWGHPYVADDLSSPTAVTAAGTTLTRGALGANSITITVSGTSNANAAFACRLLSGGAGGPIDQSVVANWANATTNPNIAIAIAAAINAIPNILATANASVVTITRQSAGTIDQLIMALQVGALVQIEDPTPYNAFGVDFACDTTKCKVGVDFVGGEEADIWMTYRQLKNSDLETRVKQAMLAQMQALGCWVGKPDFM